MAIWYDLTAALERSKITRYRLAVDAGLEPSTVYKLEKRPARLIEVDTLEAIARVLECDPLSLLTVKAEKPKRRRKPSELLARD